MSKNTLKTLAVATASVTVLSALQTNQAQAAVLTYESDLSLTSTVVLPNRATEPTTMAGLALAGSGMIATRRQLSKRVVT